MNRSVRLIFTPSLLCIAIMASIARMTFAQSRPSSLDNDAQRILLAYQAALPAESDLGVFRLDWASSLAEAKVRAAKEGRPIFFVSTTQTKDAGNLRNGHC